MLDDEIYQKKVYDMYGRHNYVLAVLNENVNYSDVFIQDGLTIIKSHLFGDTYVDDNDRHIYISKLAGIYLLLGRFQEAYDLQKTWIIKVSEKKDTIDEILSGQDMRENIVEMVECLGLLEDFLGTECELAAFWFVLVIIKIKIIEDLNKTFNEYSNLKLELSKNGKKFFENQRLKSILTKYYFGSDLKTFLELLKEQERQLAKIMWVICKMIVRTRNDLFTGIMNDFFVKKSHYHQEGLLGIAKYFSLKPEFKRYLQKFSHGDFSFIENYVSSILL